VSRLRQRVSVAAEALLQQAKPELGEGRAKVTGDCEAAVSGDWCRSFWVYASRRWKVFRDRQSRQCSRIVGVAFLVEPVLFSARKGGDLLGSMEHQR
jgi:hypothetical protein